MKEDKLRTIKVSQVVWRDLKKLSLEYEMSLSKVVGVLLAKMREK